LNNYWMIETHGDPIGAIQGFIQTVWKQAGLDQVLASANGNGTPRLLKDPASISEVNPFRPLMRENISRHIPEMLNRYPGTKLGVLLRPCEMRALVEISKRKPFSREQMMTICFDCLGTYPLDEYEWRVRKKDQPGGLADETLRFARQGGILAYRYRAACQICASPGAQSADLNFHVLGLPVRQVILIEVNDDGTAETLNFAESTNGIAEQALIDQHRHLLTKQEERHAQTMERVLNTLDELLPKNIEDLIAQLDNCGDCQRCMSICPICSAEFPRRDADGHYNPISIRRWLVSCAGCGMCEQVCMANLPLGVIFGTIRKKLDEELAYTPGRDWNDPLPL